MVTGIWLCLTFSSFILTKGPFQGHLHSDKLEPSRWNLSVVLGGDAGVGCLLHARWVLRRKYLFICVLDTLGVRVVARGHTRFKGVDYQWDNSTSCESEFVEDSDSLGAACRQYVLQMPTCQIGCLYSFLCHRLPLANPYYVETFLLIYITLKIWVHKTEVQLLVSLPLYRLLRKMLGGKGKAPKVVRFPCRRCPKHFDGKATVTNFGCVFQ